jgi:hypothetical protein
VIFKLEELKKWSESRIPSVSTERKKAHYHFAVFQISLFQKDPYKFNVERPLLIPPGAPIGGKN